MNCWLRFIGVGIWANLPSKSNKKPFVKPPPGPSPLIRNLVLLTALAVGSSGNKSNAPLAELEALEMVLLEKPNHAGAANLLVYDLTISGYFQKAVVLAQRMVDLDPLSQNTHHRLAAALSGSEFRESWRKFTTAVTTAEID